MALCSLGLMFVLRLEGSQLIEGIKRLVLLVLALIDDLFSLNLILRHRGVGLPQLLVRHSRCVQHLPCSSVREAR